MGKFLRRHFGRMHRIRSARARHAEHTELNPWPHYAPEQVELDRIRREDAAWTPTDAAEASSEESSEEDGVDDSGSEGDVRVLVFEGNPDARWVSPHSAAGKERAASLDADAPGSGEASSSDESASDDAGSDAASSDAASDESSSDDGSANAEAPPSRKPRGAAVGDESEDSDEDAEPRDEPLEPFDLYAALGVRKARTGVAGGKSRCFAQFHAKAVKCDPEWFRGRSDYDDEAWREYRRVALAFVVLNDDERRAVYDAAGYAGLQKSESYSELNAFEVDPIGVFDDFFEAKCPLTGLDDVATKEYLLLAADDPDAGWEEDEDMPVVPRGGGRAREAVDVPFPRPPPHAAAASLALSDTVMSERRTAQYPGADAWARIASDTAAPEKSLAAENARLRAQLEELKGSKV